MIQTQTKCPPENELIDYLLGKLPEELLPQLESHFEDCAICEETIRGLSATDTLNQFVVSQFVEQADPQPEDRQFVSGLIEKLQLTTFVRGRDRAAIQERAVEVIRLLDEADRAESLGQLGEYRIEELIGAGSTGVVFRAIDRQLDRCVALKVLRPSLGEAARQRFMAEARAAASIEHPNVITIYQVGQHNSLAFIAMQWLPGETLEERLARVTFLPENQVRDIAQQIAAGLQAAHHKTLIHRDIKPANIWLCEASDQAIILDFGLARIADEDPHMTSTGMLAGTPNFMSPEQTRGQELDGRSDLFSLGCLMYRAATGKLPFGAGGVLATLQSIQLHQPSVPLELNPNLSPDFSDLVMCLLDKQPANRPSGADDLIHALGHPRESWPFAATPYRSQPAAPQAATQSRTQTDSRRRRWIAASTLVTLLAAGYFAFGQQIIRIATNQGEIVIETDDENVQVEILTGGEVVRVIDTSTQQRIAIEAGKYQITARDPNNANGEFKISNNRIVLTRGGQQVVSVDLIEESSNANSSNATTTEPLFKGKTFNEWLVEVSHERSKDAIATGIEALGTLPDPEFKHAIPALIKIFESDELCDRLVTDAKLYAPAILSAGGVGGNSLFQSDIPMQDGVIPGRDIPADRDTVRADILYRIGNRGEFASPALPWLDQIAISDSPLKQHAAFAANKVRGEVLKTGGFVPELEGISKDNSNNKNSSSVGNATVEDVQLPAKNPGNEIPPESKHQDVSPTQPVPVGDDMLKDPTIELLSKIARNSRDHTERQWVSVYLTEIPPAWAVDFIRQETQSGNESSRSLVASFAGTDLQKELKAALRNELPVLIEAVLENSGGFDSESAAIRLIDSLLHSLYLEYDSVSGFRNIAVPSSEVVRLLEQQLDKWSNEDSKVRIATRLLELKTGSDVAMRLFVEFLGNERLLEDHVGSFYFQTISQMAPEQVGLVLNQLKTIYDNGVLIGVLTRRFQGKPMTSFREEIGHLPRFKDLPDNNLDSVWTRNMMIFNIGELGIHGKTALDWLDEIADGDSPQQPFAVQAAENIRAAIDGK